MIRRIFWPVWFSVSAFLVCCGIWFFSLSVSAHEECIRLGYAAVHYAPNVFHPYCAKRVNGTDVVIPLEQARAK
jgi:hypothetical protein